MYDHVLRGHPPTKVLDYSFKSCQCSDRATGSRGQRASPPVNRNIEGLARSQDEGEEWYLGPSIQFHTYLFRGNGRLTILCVAGVGTGARLPFMKSPRKSTAKRNSLTCTQRERGHTCYV
jgi:hypothetical protein